MRGQLQHNIEQVKLRQVNIVTLSTGYVGSRLTSLRIPPPQPTSSILLPNSGVVSSSHERGSDCFIRGIRSLFIVCKAAKLLFSSHLHKLNHFSICIVAEM